MMMFLLALGLVVLLVAHIVDTADDNGIIDRVILNQELELVQGDFKSQMDYLRNHFQAESRRLQRKILSESNERKKERQNLEQKITRLQQENSAQKITQMQLENHEQKIIRLQTIVSQMREEWKSLHGIPVSKVFESLLTEKRSRKNMREDVKNLKTAVRMCSDQIRSLRVAAIKNNTDQEERLSGVQLHIAERCVYPPYPENGQADVEGRFHGDKVRYTCNPGYQMSGPEERTCFKSYWTGMKPNCEPMECFNKPSNPENGQANVEGRFHGDKVRYTCNPGYQLSGTEERTCSKGNWTETNPTCEPMECFNKLANPENGQADAEGRFHGDKVRYSCNLGYLLIGDEERTCSHGNWTGRKPLCSPIPQLPELRFTEAYGVTPGRVPVIEEAGAAVSDGPDRAEVTTVRTDGALTAGRHYWELDLTWRFEEPGWPPLGWWWVAGVGVRRDGSDFSVSPGHDDQSWAVRVDSSRIPNQWRYVCLHGGEAIFISEPFTHDGRSDIINRLGLLLDTEKQTLAVVDINNNSPLFSFRAVDGSKPLVPAVRFEWKYFQRRFRLRTIDRSRLPETVTDLLHNP